MAAPPLPVIPHATFNVTNYGAFGDGKTIDTIAIQKTIGAASAAGGGTVQVPPGKFLTGPFTLASQYQSASGTGRDDSDQRRLETLSVVNHRYQDSITVADAHDVEISGDGTIDGQGAAWWAAFRANREMTHRPYMIKISNCTRVLVTGVTLQNSPMFHLVPQNCTDVTIRAITIHSPENAPNTDGIDPSGWNFLIADCHIDTGDDNIAIKPVRGKRTPGNKNFLVEHCAFVHGHGMSIGSGTAGGLEDLTVRNCTFDQTDRAIRIKTLRGNGGLLSHCLYENLKITAIKKSPISIVDYYPERNAPKNPATEKAEPVNDRTPLNEDIVIRNVTVTDCPNAGVIRGLPEAPIDGLTFDHVNISAKTGMIIYHAKNIRFEHSKITVQKGKPLITYDAQVTGLE